MKIFLDDVRIPKDCIGYMYHRIGKDNPIYLEEWVVVRDYDQFKEVFLKRAHEITHISFDHDLEYIIEGQNAPEEITEINALFYAREAPEDAKTGLDCAKLVKEFYDEYNLPYPVMFVHSQNPVGTQNIINLFKDG